MDLRSGTSATEVASSPATASCYGTGCRWRAWNAGRPGTPRMWTTSSAGRSLRWSGPGMVPGPTWVPGPAYGRSWIAQLERPESAPALAPPRPNRPRMSSRLSEKRVEREVKVGRKATLA